MDRRLNVSLGFNADTRAAKQQIQSLQDQLTALVNSPVGLGEKLTADLVKASHAAAELKVHLKNATNVDTGALDFSKLNQSITKSGQSLSSYASQLQKLGPQGQQAFMSLANAVASAEVPLKRSNALLNNFMTTLKNTAKWQLSSSLLHGLQSGVQEAYGYAQDLNESLNNIRIVTGQNIDQMARFAKEANNAAKALSTTTTEYTNASLIYYQQGLSPQEVKERTDLTIKMANVARVSAEAASDQLTAVWNNFADGTKSLEYYVDVMTALGAKTASSTDEIAGGLEKFAGIADTIGLSYEYATSALATLTSNTRQSEEVVGTALKTIFARIQGLNLGETLEDGVTLNKYSQAMKTVGIDILDQQKNLKSMDTLLDELGNKWNTISKAQQTALAQTVAGTRQYTQLVSLMDNWNKGDEDSFLSNLATARGSSGALQEQADIYAESWEAARDRVTAAAEEIYASLFNDEDFIKITNLFAGMIDLVGDFTQSIGGLEGVLSGLGLIMTKVFSEQMAQGFRNIAYNVQMSTEAGRKAVQQQKVKIMDEFATMMADNETSGVGARAAKEAYSQELQLQTELIANADKMTEAEREKCQYLLEQQKAYGQQTIELARQLEILEDQKDESAIDIYGEALSGGMRQDSITKRLFGTQDNRSSSLTGISTIIGNTAIEIQKLGTVTDFTEDQMNSLKVAFKDIGDSKVRDKLNGMVNALGGMKAGSEEAQQQLLKLQGILDSVANKKVQDFLDHSGLEKGTTEYNNLSKALNSYIEYNKQAIVQETKLAQSQDKLNTSFMSVEEAIKTAKGVTKDWANHLSTMTSSLMSLGMLMSSISGLMDTLEDPNTSGWEKFGQVLTSVSMIAMSFTGIMQGVAAGAKLVKDIFSAETKEKLLNAAASIIQAKAEDKVNDEKKETVKQSRESIRAHKQETREKIKNAATSGLSYDEKTGTYLSNGTEISKEVYQGALTKQFMTSTVLPTIGYAGAAAAAIALLAVTITGVIAHYQKWNIEAEKAAEAAKMLKDRADEVKTSFDEFTNLSDGYKNAKKSLEDLTRGTEEYNKALVESNAQAMELLEKYDSLAGHYTIGQDGLIEIDSAALAAAQAEQLKAVQEAQSAALLGNVVSNNAAYKAQQVNMSRELNSARDNWATVGNAAGGYAVGGLAGAGIGTAIAGGMALGATAGTVVPVIGTLIGLAVGAIAGTVAGVVSTEIAGATAELETETLEQIAEHYEKDPNIFIDDKTFEQFLRAEIGLKDEPLIRSLVENRKAVEELTKAEQLRAAQEKSDWKAAFNAAAANNAIYAASADKDALANLAYNDVDEKLRSQAADRVDALFSGSNDDFWAKYLETVYGQSGVSMDGAGVTGEDVRVRNLGGGAVTIEKKNADGIWERVGDKNGLDESVARDQLVEAEAQRMAEAAMSKYNTTIEDLTNDLLDAGLKEGNETHEQAIHDILSQFTDKGNVDLTDYAYNIIKGLDTNDIGNSELQDAIKTAKENYLNGLSDLKKKIFEAGWYTALTDKETEIFWTIDIDQYETLDNVREAWEAAQAYVEHNKLIGTIEVADALGGLLVKEGKSDEDWTNIKTEYEKLLKDNPGAKSWTEFMKLNQQEQIKYVQAIKSGSITSGGAASADAIQAATIHAQSTQQDYDKALAEYEQKLADAKALRDAGITEEGNAAFSYNGYMATGERDYRDSLTAIFGASTSTNHGPIWSQDQVQKIIEASGLPYYILEGLNSEDPMERLVAIQKARQSKGWNTSNDAIDKWIEEWSSGDLATNGWQITDLTKLFTLLNYDETLTPNVLAGYGIVESVGDSPRTTEKDNAEKTLIELYQQQQAALDAQEAYFVEIGLSADDVQSLATGLGMVNAELEENEYLANAVAASMLRYSKGVKAVAENYDTWLEVLTNGNTSQRAQILPQIQEAVGNIFNVDSTLLDENFLADPAILDQLGGVIGGDDKSYNAIQTSIGQNLLGKAAQQTGYLGKLIRSSLANAVNSSLAEGTLISPETQEELYEQILNLYNLIISQAEQEGKDSATAKNLGANFLRAIGFDIGEQDINTKEILSLIKLSEKYEEVTDDLADDLKDKQLAEIERYKTINDQLDELSDKYSDATKQVERLYGQARLDKMSKANQILQNEIYLLEEKKRVEAEAYKTTDRQVVNDALAKMGVGTFDYEEGTGIITNYRTIMEAAKAKAEGTGADDPLRESYQELLDAIEQYDQTRELLRDLENQVIDKHNQIQDTNYQKLIDKLNYGLDTTEAILQDINFSLSLIEDNAYKAAEALSLMIGEIEKDGTWSSGGQLKAYQDMLSAYAIGDDKITGGYVAELIAAQASGKISDDAFVEGMKESRDAIYSNLEALTGLDKQMLEYYGNTLAAAGEEIGKYTDRMEHLTSVLDHYSAIMKLIGKEKNYEMMGEILKGSAKTLENTLAVSKAEYEFYKNEEQTKRTLYEANKDTPAGELFKKEWEAAEAAMRESQNRMLEDTKAWAEAEKAVIENAMEAAAASLERSLTGGDTFDFLTTRLDHAVSIQEEYLTTTNKIYETTKLMRTAQQAVDAATNATTKQKLKNFITETQQLQDQTDLSKYELEIQQAKYDLLLAEIALQDAQNAKSMVRLKRDSEGNFGYVYTADDNQVAEAQQNLEDAENNLYNIALRGAEDYTTKSIEIRQEMWEKLQELDKQHRDGAFVDEEEYQRARDELIAYYTHKIEDYSKFYGIAIETDNRVIADSWSTTFTDILKSTENWNTEVSNYLSESETSFIKWQDIVTQVATDTGLDMNTLASTVKEVTDESDALKKSLAGDGKEDKGLIGTLENVLKGVSDLTLKYAPHRSEVEKLVEKYQAWAEEIQAVINNMKNLNDFDLEDPNGVPPPKIGTEEGIGGNNETNISGSSPATNVGTTSSTFNPMDHIGRVVSVINLGGVAMSKASKQALGIDGWLKISGIAKNNGNTLFEVTNDAGEVVGSFLKEDLFPINQFASGGYTGEWGPSGKLAMLHEKELILNQMDTFNMLTAVDTLHKILEIIDLQSLNASLGGMLSVPGYRDTGSGMLEQNVKIEATFPNVSDHFEIEEAFNTLINQASQYANRK